MFHPVLQSYLAASQREENNSWCLRFTQARKEVKVKLKKKKEKKKDPLAFLCFKRVQILVVKGVRRV